MPNHSGFVTRTGAADSPVILHVPHSSRSIPADVRHGITLTDQELARELAFMTDALTDVIAARAANAAASRPWQFVNQQSRLVVDPERFPDEREAMRRVGMGAVYTRTSHGARLRRDDDRAAEQALVEAWFIPYADAFADLVDARLAATGMTTILDIHSYPSTQLPYELGGKQRPAVCLGTHPVHTPTWLLAAAHDAFADFGAIGENAPFEGCYVPLRHYGTHADVTAIMIELRRDTYLAEATGQPTTGLAAATRCLSSLIDGLTRL